MAYSRWIDSKWYTFYSGASPENDKFKQVFEICDVTCFTYHQLMTSMDDCISDILKYETATKAEVEELKGYMQEFLDDVDNDFKSKEVI